MVLQGSVLGPLLFVIYIYNVYTASDNLEFHLFADDSNLLYADKKLKSLETTVKSNYQKFASG